MATKIRRRTLSTTESPESRTCPPAWAWLIAGILIGIFLSFLVYLREIAPYTQGQTPIPFPQMHASDGKTLPITEPTPLATTQPSEPLKFDFTFYDKLMESQVDVVGTTPAQTPHAFPADLAPSPHLPMADTGVHILQVGSFKGKREADGLKAHLALLGFQAYLEAATVNGETWHRVRIGPFSDAASLQQVQQQLRQHNVDAIVLQF